MTSSWRFRHYWHTSVLSGIVDSEALTAHLLRYSITQECRLFASNRVKWPVALSTVLVVYWLSRSRFAATATMSYEISMTRTIPLLNSSHLDVSYSWYRGELAQSVYPPLSLRRTVVRVLSAARKDFLQGYLGFPPPWRYNINTSGATEMIDVLFRRRRITLSCALHCTM